MDEIMSNSGFILPIMTILLPKGIEKKKNNRFGFRIVLDLFYLFSFLLQIILPHNFKLNHCKF
jgi:hypothetical protein